MAASVGLRGDNRHMSSLSSTNSVLVIGGGVIGLFTARALLAKGFGVTVIEAAEAGRSASWAAGGILSPLPPWGADPVVWKLAEESIRAYPSICAELLRITGIDPQWAASGLWIGSSDDGRERWLKTRAIPSEAHAVLLHGEPSPGTLLPWVAQLRSPRLMQALIADFRMRGGTLLERQGSLQWEHSSNAVQAVVTANGHRHAATAYVLAAGAWSAGLAGQLGVPTPVQPVRGQMLLIRAGVCSLQHILLLGDRYLIPRRDGRIVVGSTVEHCGFDPGTSTDAAANLLHFAQGLIPGLGAADIEAQWSGLRPMAPGGVPLIGRLSGFENVWQNNGHYRNGITLAPASAQCLLQQMDS